MVLKPPEVCARANWKKGRAATTFEKTEGILRIERESGGCGFECNRFTVYSLCSIFSHVRS
jgi:hypothetical protein